jgi:hypothetical protein
LCERRAADGGLAVNTLFIIHISDTHFALDTEQLNLRSTHKTTHKTPLEGLVNQLRLWTFKQNGTRAHEPSLWQELLGTLRHTADGLRGREGAVIHTGDITQAGQLESLEQALEAIKGDTHPFPLHAIVGNHDLWPRDFPGFSPTKTAEQFSHIRNMKCMQDSPQVGVPLGRGPSAELYLGCSAVADSLMNSVALGKLEPEEGHLPPPLKPRRQSPPPAGLSSVLLTNLRIAALHHPIIDSGGSRWRAAQAGLGLSLGMVLQDAPQVQALLDQRGVRLVLCGHEHARAPRDKRLCCDDRLLQLTAGCPTLYQSKGNGASPQFSLYIIDECAGQVPWLTLDSYVCRLEPRRWSFDASYQHDGKRWHVSAGAHHALPGALAQKQMAPFSQAP